MISNRTMNRKFAMVKLKEQRQVRLPVYGFVYGFL